MTDTTNWTEIDEDFYDNLLNTLIVEECLDIRFDFETKITYVNGHPAIKYECTQIEENGLIRFEFKYYCI